MNKYKQYEDEIERKIKELKNEIVGSGKKWDEIEHQISDLKHQLWQSRL